VKKIDAHMHVSGGGQSFFGCDVESVIDAADRLEIDPGLLDSDYRWTLGHARGCSRLQ
jgi:predicted amidohydrolase YtcJ